MVFLFAEFNSIEEEVKWLRNRLRVQDADIKQQRLEIDWNEEKLFIKESTISDLKEDLARLKEDIARKDEKIASKNEEIWILRRQKIFDVPTFSASVSGGERTLVQQSTQASSETYYSSLPLSRRRSIDSLPRPAYSKHSVLHVADRKVFSYRSVTSRSSEYESTDSEGHTVWNSRSLAISRHDRQNRNFHSSPLAHVGNSGKL